MQRLVDEEDLSGGGGGQSQSNGVSGGSAQSQWSGGDVAAQSDRQSQSAAAPTAVVISVFTPAVGPHSPSATAGSSAVYPGPSHGHGPSGAGPVAAGGFAAALPQSQHSQPLQAQSFGAPVPGRSAQFRWFLHLPVLSDGPALVVHSENPDVRAGCLVLSLDG